MGNQTITIREEDYKADKLNATVDRILESLNAGNKVFIQVNLSPDARVKAMEKGLAIKEIQNKDTVWEIVAE